MNKMMSKFQRSCNWNHRGRNSVVKLSNFASFFRPLFTFHFQWTNQKNAKKTFTLIGGIIAPESNNAQQIQMMEQPLWTPQWILRLMNSNYHDAWIMEWLFSNSLIIHVRLIKESFTFASMSRVRETTSAICVWSRRSSVSIVIAKAITKLCPQEMMHFPLQMYAMPWNTRIRFNDWNQVWLSSCLWH